MKKAQQLLLPLSKLIPMRQLIHLSGQRLLLPFYHSVKAKKKLAHIEQLYSLRNTQEFEADLDFLLQHYQAIALEDLIQSIQEDKAVRQNSFFLSFDDGLRECYDLIAPILKRKGIPACFFLNTAFIDNKALFYRYKTSLILDHLEKKKPSKNLTKKLEDLLNDADVEGWTLQEQILHIDYRRQALCDQIAALLGLDFKSFLQQQQPYLSSKQIKQLQKDGFQFGAHSIDHPLYAELSPLDQIVQTKESLHFLQKKIPQKIRSFAFPFTDDGVSASFFEKMNQEDILDISFGTAGLKKDSCPFHFQRLPMEVEGYTAEEIIKSSYGYYLAKAPLGKNLIYRETIE